MPPTQGASWHRLQEDTHSQGAGLACSSTDRLWRCGAAVRRLRNLRPQTSPQTRKETIKKRTEDIKYE
eukprot:1865943-Amphidinium_carterae.1